jgi:hypothetical protein
MTGEKTIGVGGVGSGECVFSPAASPSCFSRGIEDEVKYNVGVCMLFGGEKGGTVCRRLY